MASLLKNHPFAVEAFFTSSVVLSFAIPKEELAPVIPPCLEPDILNDTYGFFTLAMVQTRNLRPKGFPAFLGNDFFLIGYRVFVKYINREGKRLRGIYILGSQTDRKKMEIFGNIFTHYNYSTTDITTKNTAGSKTIFSKASGLQVVMNNSENDVPLPQGSPFKDWKEARRFAGPLPFTFTYNEHANEVIIIEGVRQNWEPKPVHILQYYLAFLENFNFSKVILANAFEVKYTILLEKRKGRNMETIRKPYQGIINIFKFNWHLYALSFATIIIILLLCNFLFHYPVAGILISLLILSSIIISAIVSWYIYDSSDFYSLSWLEFGNNTSGNNLNIHAGFDETSALIQNKFKDVNLTVCDFYDPVLHTEPSIKRARKAYPAHPGTLTVSTRHLPFADGSFMQVFLVFAAHEIRNEDEKKLFFKEVCRVLEAEGRVHVVEHLQDLPNFLAFNLGFFHFAKKSTWTQTFAAAGLQTVSSKKLNPFVHYFILGKNGTAS